MSQIMEFFEAYKIYLAAGILAVIFIVAMVLVLTKKREKEENNKLKKEVELSDRLFKPAQISIKFVYRDVEQAIEKYIKSIYNNNPMMLPEKMTGELLRETMEKIERKISLGVKMQLIKYEPAERFSIKQDNSSVYTVMFLTAIAEYKVEYYTEHSTYRRFVSKDVRQEIVFEGTNDEGWVMKSIGEEEIISSEQKDL